MSAGTKIEWTDDSWNPIRAIAYDWQRSPDGYDPPEPVARIGWHCERVSDGCVHCYAERMNADRFGTGLPYTRPSRDKVDIYLDERTLTQPLHWQKPRRVFVCSMTDLFGEWVTDEMLDWVWAVMALTPHITYQVLTKRPARMREYLGTATRHTPIIAAMNALANVNAVALRWPLPNVWLGTSVEDEPSANKRVPELLATPAAIRFLSMEPLLEGVDLRRWLGGPDSEQGRATVPGGDGWGTDDRPDGASVAARSQARGPMDRRHEVPPLHPAPGGESDGKGGIPTGARDDRWGASTRAGAPVGLPPLLRSYSEWDGGEPSERQQTGQQAGESGGGDVFRELRALTPGAAQGQSESIRGTERDGEVERRASSDDSQASGGGRGTEQHRGVVRGELPGDLEDRSGRPLGSIGWLICGGESGPGARPTDIAWIRSIAEQCKAAEVPVFVKQLGSKPIDRHTTCADTHEPKECWPKGTRTDVHRILLRDRKGGDMAEFPADLQIREYPS